jgi:predicted nucleic acid-binding Zn ribbon protein
MTDNPLKDCPSCGMAELRRVINNVGVVFKGSGFYVTDSRKSSSNGSSSSTSASKSKENKSEKTTDSSSNTAASE